MAVPASGIHLHSCVARVKKPPRRIKCRWCAWNVQLLQTILGKKRSGWNRLWEHARDKHPSKMEEVRVWLRPKL